LLDLEPRANCRLCQKPLTDGRFVQCHECDNLVAEEIARRAARDAIERIDLAMRRSKLPTDYASGARRTGDLPGGTHHVLSMCQTLGNGIRGLYLWGPAGCYKTSLAASFMASQIRGGAVGKYIAMHDLLADIHKSYRSNDTESKADLVAAAVAAPCLVIDDLGKEKASEHAAMVLFEILDGRYRNAGKGQWMIVTSNYSLDALCNRFTVPELADPIRRRLSEMTVAVEMK
jgi:DNA replication protein DnaC